MVDPYPFPEQVQLAIKSMTAHEEKLERALVALYTIAGKPDFFADPPTSLHAGSMGQIHLYVRDIQHLWAILPSFNHIRRGKIWFSHATKTVVHAIDWTDLNVEIWIYVPQSDDLCWCTSCPQATDLTGDGCVGCDCPHGDETDE